jgi:hypothetical protein
MPKAVQSRDGRKTFQQHQRYLKKLLVSIPSHKFSSSGENYAGSTFNNNGPRIKCGVVIIQKINEDTFGVVGKKTVSSLPHPHCHVGRGYQRLGGKSWHRMKNFAGILATLQGGRIWRFVQ